MTNFLKFKIEEDGDFKLVEVQKNIPPQNNPNFLANHDNALQ